MDDASPLFAAAVAHHLAGRIEEADQLYQQTIAADPNHAEAWHRRGVIAMHLGQPAIAVQAIERAIELQPTFVDAYNNLGLIFEMQGRLNEAAECFRRAMATDRGFVAAIGNLGSVLRQQGLVSDAIAVCRRALELDPSLAGVHYNLGVALHSAGMNDEAAPCYRRAIELDPNFAEANNNFGLLLMERGQIEAAEAYFERAISRKPAYPDALNNLGTLRIGQGRPDEAIAALDRALQVQPNYAQAHVNLANVYNRENRLDEAAASCDRALALDMRSAEAHAVCGDVLKSSGCLVEAIAAYRRALELKPHSPVIHAALLYGLYFCPGQDSAAIYAEHCQWNERHAKRLYKFVHSQRRDAEPSRRLRIGYVSPHFHSHCQAFFTTPLFLNHDHAQFEIFCYSKSPRLDNVTELLRQHADHWRNTFGLSDEQVANLIWRDQIDILVDLTMHMELGGLLLFARRPAPVQVCWLAYPGTTGLTAIDYRLTDPYLDPPGMFDRFYSEKSFRLPHSFWCYDPLATEPAINRLPALANGFITFGCLNNFCKTNAGILQLWADVLKVVDRSRLILLAPEGSCRHRISAALDRQGIAPERITFVPFQKRAAYLTTYHHIDIGLETLPYNGHTTSLDSFWMGVPVPTIVGETVVGRAGVSLLQNLGLGELIAYSPAEYIDIVSQLAADLPRLAELRSGLRERMQKSPLMNASQFARDIESAYREIWRRWCDQQENQ